MREGDKFDAELDRHAGRIQALCHDLFIVMLAAQKDVREWAFLEVHGAISVLATNHLQRLRIAAKGIEKYASNSRT